MDKRVKKLEASMAGQTSDAELERKLSPIRQRQAETGADLHKIRGEITRLSGMTSENRWLIEKSTKQQGSKIEAMGKQLSELENDTAYLQDYLGLEPKGPVRGEDVVRQPALQQPSSASEDAGPPAVNGFEKALSDFRAGKLQKARRGFEDYLERYPDSDLADAARFHIGVCHMGLKQYEKAILAFHKFITDYPNNDKVPRAMLEQALAFHQIGDDTAARIVLHDIIQEYPASVESEKAKERLQKLEKAP